MRRCRSSAGAGQGAQRAHSLARRGFSTASSAPSTAWSAKQENPCTENGSALAGRCNSSWAMSARAAALRSLKHPRTAHRAGHSTAWLGFNPPGPSSLPWGCMVPPKASALWGSSAAPGGSVQLGPGGGEWRSVHGVPSAHGALPVQGSPAAVGCMQDDPRVNCKEGRAQRVHPCGCSSSWQQGQAARHSSSSSTCWENWGNWGCARAGEISGQGPGGSCPPKFVPCYR